MMAKRDEAARTVEKRKRIEHGETPAGGDAVYQADKSKGKQGISRDLRRKMEITPSLETRYFAKRSEKRAARTVGVVRYRTVKGAFF